MGKLTAMRTARQLRDDGHPASKVLLVGELNPYGGPDSNALVPWPVGCAGHRLQSKILGVDEETYLAMNRRNLCRAVWNLGDARIAAQEICVADVWPWTSIVLLGRKVAQAFWMRGSKKFDPNTIVERMMPFGVYSSRRDWEHPVPIVTLPHPSGRNTIWNNAGAIDQARSLLRQAIPDVEWGSCSI